MSKEKPKDEYGDLNQELLTMRKELHKAYYDYMLNFYAVNDVERALSYFLAMPTVSRGERSSIACLIECCDVAKAFREQAR
jgi:hypothetical protein